MIIVFLLTLEVVLKWIEMVRIYMYVIKFGIRDFYPSITETIRDKALLLVKQHHDISNENTRLIKHCRKSLVFSNNEAWK